ncbi:MAG: AlpA family phage regulatory protein [Pseudomonadota bacterium]|nr:AlpA family phage regulatory protein [Pseudomonadota bacterium]
MQHLSPRRTPLPMPQPFSERLFSMHEVLVMTGLHRATLWRLRRSGRFPVAIPLPGRRVAWRGADLLDWLGDPEGWGENRD